MSVRELSDRGSRPDEVRRANECIAERADRLRFVSRVPMLCECGDPGCAEIVLVGLVEYRKLRRDPRRFLTVTGHTVEGASVEATADGYSVQRR